MKPLEVSRCLTNRVAGVDENTACRVLISCKGAGIAARSLTVAARSECDSLIGFLSEGGSSLLWGLLADCGRICLQIVRLPAVLPYSTFRNPADGRLPKKAKNQRFFVVLVVTLLWGLLADCGRICLQIVRVDSFAGRADSQPPKVCRAYSPVSSGVGFPAFSPWFPVFEPFIWFVWSLPAQL